MPHCHDCATSRWIDRYTIAVPSAEEFTKVRSNLSGVPETLLGNLVYRAAAASGPRPVLDDPKAIELIKNIDYPFERIASDRSGQRHALRVSRFDDEIRRFLAEHPAGTVVALGEGLETQFWRVDNGQAQWLTVDLPETVALRRRLLPDGPRQRTLACSASDSQWMDQVDPSHGVLVTAQGLLMYFQPAEVDRLVEQCAQRFPGQQLLFDAVPNWLIRQQKRAARRKHGTYHLAAWIWGINAAEQKRLAALPAVARLTKFRLIRGHGLWYGLVLPVLRRVPWLRDLLPEFPVFRVQLASQAASPAHPDAT
jgi:O-methyltransferase involved in polyketide biosynthesis